MAYPYRKLIKPPLGTPINKAIARRLGIIGYWSMNENGGLKALDLSGNENDGNIVGATWQPCKYGAGLKFDGSAGDYVDCGAADITEGLARMSISFWFRQIDGAAAPETKYLVDKINSTEIYWSTNEYVYFVAGVTSGSSSAYYNKLTDTNWHHVVGIWDGATAKIRFDGSSTGCTNGAAQTGTTTAQAWNLYLGGRSNNSGILNGYLDHVMICNRVPTDFEIALLYREPFYMFKDPAEVALLGGYQVVVGATPKGPLHHPLRGALAGPIFCNSI